MSILSYSNIFVYKHHCVLIVSQVSLLIYFYGFVPLVTYCMCGHYNAR